MLKKLFLFFTALTLSVGLWAGEPAITGITITGDKFVGTELTFAASVSGFSATPTIIYEVKAGEGEYEQAQGGKFTPAAAGDYTVKATAFYLPDEGDSEEASSEVVFTVTVPAPNVGIIVNVTVPANTPACYFYGEMSNNAFAEMTKVDDTHYTIEFPSATSIGWGYLFTWESSNWSTKNSNPNGDITVEPTGGVINVEVIAWATAPASTPAVGDKFVDATSGLKFQITAVEGTPTVKVIANSYSGTTYTIPATVTYKDVDFTVTEIGSQAFSSCSSLQSVTFLGTSCSIGDYAFYEVGKDEPAALTLPANWTGTLPNEEGNWYGGKFELVSGPTPCAKVEGVKAILPNTVGATISWAASSATQWEIVVADDELTADEIAAGDEAIVKDTITTQNPFVVNFCPEINKLYYVYVRALCSETSKGEWSNVLTFKTTCVAKTAEGYGFIDFAKDGFGTSEFPCWTVGRREGTTALPSVTAGSHLYMFNSASSEGAYAITPPIDIDDISKLQVKFTASGGTGAAYLRELTVGVISNPLDLSTFTPIEMVKLPMATTSISNVNHAMNLDEAETFIVRFNEYAGDNDGNFGKQIMFLSENHGVANYVYVFNMQVDTISSCLEPVHFTEVEANTYDATMAWEKVGTNYEVQLLAEDKTTVLVDSLTNQQQMKFEGLNMLTKYYIQVRTICGAGDTSAWSLMRNFTTSCPVAYPVPYEQNFDDYASGAANYPDCWERFSNSSTTYPYIVSSAKKDGKNGLYMYRSTSYYSYAVLPAFENKPGELMLELDYRNNSTSYPMEMYIGIATDITSKEGIDTTIVMIDTLRAEKYSSPNNVWYHYKKPLEAYTGETGRIVFISPIAASPTTNGYAYVDNVRVVKTPSCFRPEAPTIATISASSVTLSWETLGSKTTDWDIAYVPAGGNMDYATIVPVSAGALQGTVTGLSDDTEYDFYVRANCGDGDVSEWSDAVSDKTLCKVALEDAVWNFDDYTTRVLNPNAGNNSSYPIEQCWLSKSTSTTASSQPYLNKNTYSTSYSDAEYVSSKYAYTDTFALKFYSTAAAPAIAVLPEIAADLDEMQVSFVGRSVYESYSTSMGTAGQFTTYYNTYATGSYARSIKIGTVTDPYDMSTFEELVDYQFAEVTNANCSTKVAGDYWEPVTVSLYGAQGKYIAFLSEYDATNYAWIDNVKVETESGLNMPTCLRVPEDKLSGYSADITWKSRANKFEVVVKNADGEVVAKDTVTTTAYTANELTPVKTYTVEVSALSDDEQSRSVAAKKSFTTPCAPYTVETAHWDFKDADYAYTGSTSYLIPTCWDAGQGVKSLATIYTYTPQAKVNMATFQYSREAFDASATVHDRALQFYNYSTTYADSYVILPELDVDMDNTSLHFWMRAAYFYTATYSSSESRNKLYSANNNYNKELIVGYFTDETDPSTFQSVDTVTYPYSWSSNTNVFTYNDESGNDYWTEVTLPLKKYEGKGRIAMMYKGNGKNSYMYVDDIDVQNDNLTQRDTLDAVTACGQYIWNINNKQITLTESDYYSDTLHSTTDTITVLPLTIHPTYTVTDGTTVCQNELPYTWEDTTWNAGSAAGVYSVTRNLRTINGCDSVVTFTLTIHPIYYDVTDGTVVCQNELPYTWADTTWNAGSAAGVYSVTRNLGTINDCDSVVTFTLTIYPSYYDVTDGTTVCQNELPYTWADTTWEAGSAVGVYSVTRNLRTINGCDSVVTFTLTIKENLCGYDESTHTWHVVTDVDGETYKTVKIGDKCWMAENMRAKHYANGNNISKYSSYNHDDNLTDDYGLLYSWYSAVGVPEGDNSAILPLTNGYVQGICPNGWSIPTREDFDRLFEEAGTTDALRDMNTEYWLPGAAGTTPNTGFGARAAGYYDEATDRYMNLLGETYFWTSLSGSMVEKGQCSVIAHYCPELIIDQYSKHQGFSVRCVRNE